MSETYRDPIIPQDKDEKTVGKLWGNCGSSSWCNRARAGTLSATVIHRRHEKGSYDLQPRSEKKACFLKNAKPSRGWRTRRSITGIWRGFLTILADFQTRQIFPLFFTAFPDVSSTIEQQTVEGTWVTTRTTLRGTHLGAFMGVAPTGKAIEIMHISLDQVEEGKVVEHFGVSDWLRALIAFEIVAAPAAGTPEATR
jgi:hypothetical protein